MQIRRIEQRDAERVTALWDRASRETPDGGPLQPRGRANIAAMLTLSAASPHAACFVAEGDDELHGFVLAELHDDGLLPGRYGRIEELTGPRELLPELLAAAVGWLREHGAEVIRADADEDDPEAVALLSELGWQREAIRFALYDD
ncbi:MAG TPA: hypothetical protein VD931_03060 [Baekduia sp.]|nr:hypothetical protein [Baekduia sp.]